MMLNWVRATRKTICSYTIGGFIMTDNPMRTLGIVIYNMMLNWVGAAYNTISVLTSLMALSLLVINLFILVADSLL